jgi:phycocyanobilin lyase beta subunit
LRLAGLPAEERGPIAARCLAALLAGCGDGEWVVRYAVVVGLEALAPELRGDTDGTGAILSALERLSRDDRDGASVVCLRAALALSRLAPGAALETTDG